MIEGHELFCYFVSIVWLVLLFVCCVVCYRICNNESHLWSGPHFSVENFNMYVCLVHDLEDATLGVNLRFYWLISLYFSSVYMVVVHIICACVFPCMWYTSKCKVRCLCVHLYLGDWSWPQESPLIALQFIYQYRISHMNAEFADRW